MHPVSVLFLHPSDICTNSVVILLWYREKKQNNREKNKVRQIKCQRTGYDSTVNTPTNKPRTTKNKTKKTPNSSFPDFPFFFLKKISGKRRKRRNISCCKSGNSTERGRKEETFPAVNREIQRREGENKGTLGIIPILSAKTAQDNQET